MKLIFCNSSGFSALGLIGAVSIGSILSLGYINLSHYLIAENALEQATRAAVRCVSPTNGECSSLVQPEAQPQWKYVASILSPKGDVYSDEYDYSARMYRQRFLAQTPYYSIPQELAPKVKLTTYAVPAARYREIQSFKRVDLTFQYSGDEIHNFAVPLTNEFPVFDPSWEDQYVNQPFEKKKNDATGNRLEILSRFKEVFSSNFSQSITGSESEKENGDFVHRVNLESPGSTSLSTMIEGETESCAEGNICSVRDKAGGSGSQKADDYKNFRYLALYLEVEVDSRTSNASLGIKGEGGRSGLIIDISGERHDGSICLGGRDLTKLSGLNGDNFNLYLRGATGSTGGSTSWNDPDCGGNYRASNILIDKDGSFRPRVGLVVGGQKGDKVSGKVTLYAFVDTYKPVPVTSSVTKLCQPVPLKNCLAATTVAPSAEACGLTGKETNLVRKLVSTKENSVGCVSNPQDPTLIPRSAELPQVLSDSLTICGTTEAKEIVEAQCSGDSKATELSTCGWTLVPGLEKIVEVGTLPENSCPGAEKKQELGDCVNTTSISSCNFAGLQPSSCSAAKEKVTQLTAVDKIKGLPVGANDEFVKELIRGTSAVPKFSCLQEKSIDGRLECGVLTQKTLYSESQMKRADPSWKPTALSSFKADGEEPICGQISPEQVKLADSNSEIVEVTGKPFDGDSSLEISATKPMLVGNKIQCGRENDQPLTVEERLREYAALSGLPEARDPALQFDFEAKPLGTTKLVSNTLGCVTKEFAAVDGCPELRTMSTGTEDCHEEIQLGVSETEPALCREPGVNCRKVFDGLSQFQPAPLSPDESLKKAAQIAASVLQKYLPQSQANCTAQNCTEVKIKLNPDKTVSAIGTYEMPLTWPLNELLGKKTLELNRTRTERVEAL